MQSTLIVNVLRSRYPNILTEIETELSRDLPEIRLTDLKHIKLVVSAFRKAHPAMGGEIDFKKSTEIAFIGGNDKFTPTYTSELRRKLVAVVLMFFHPEKLHGIDKGNAKRGVFRYLAKIIDCRPVTIYLDSSISCARFRLNKAFKDDVLSIYEKIKKDLPI